MRFQKNSGEEVEVATGVVGWVLPNHDCWVVGDEWCEMIELGLVVRG